MCGSLVGHRVMHGAVLQPASESDCIFRVHALCTVNWRPALLLALIRREGGGREVTLPIAGSTIGGRPQQLIKKTECTTEIRCLPPQEATGKQSLRNTFHLFSRRATPAQGSRELQQVTWNGTSRQDRVPLVVGMVSD